MFEPRTRSDLKEFNSERRLVTPSLVGSEPNSDHSISYVNSDGCWTLSEAWSRLADLTLWITIIFNRHNTKFTEWQSFSIDTAQSNAEHSIMLLYKKDQWKKVIQPAIYEQSVIQSKQHEAIKDVRNTRVWNQRMLFGFRQIFVGFRKFSLTIHQSIVLVACRKLMNNKQCGQICDLLSQNLIILYCVATPHSLTLLAISNTRVA